MDDKRGHESGQFGSTIRRFYSLGLNIEMRTDYQVYLGIKKYIKTKATIPISTPHIQHVTELVEFAKRNEFDSRLLLLLSVRRLPKAPYLFIVADNTRKFFHRSTVSKFNLIRKLLAAFGVYLWDICDWREGYC